MQNVLHGPEKFTIKPNYYRMALAEYKAMYPYKKREDDFDAVDRARILKRAAELSDGKY